MICSRLSKFVRNKTNSVEKWPEVIGDLFGMNHH